jgi:concanavalin A-like lectin/glucanase superfamily protein
MRGRLAFGLALLCASCAGQGAGQAALAIHVGRADSFAAAVDGLVVRVETAGATYQHRATPTAAFDGSGDVVLFLAGELRGACTVSAVAYDAATMVGTGSAQAMLGSDSDVVVVVGAGESCPECITPEEPDPDLVAWWRFEETTGDAADASGHGNDAGVPGAVARGEPGVQGDGVVLPGNADLVAPDAASLDVAGDFTIEAWIRPDVLSGNCGTSGNAIVSKWRSSPEGQYQLATCSSGQLRLVSSDGAHVTVLTTTTALVEGDTVHVAARVAQGTAAILIDGRPDAELAVSPPAASEYPQDDLHLGGAVLPGWGFSGMLDEVRIWRVARSDDDICRDAGGDPTGGDCDLSEVLP